MKKVPYVPYTPDFFVGDCVWVMQDNKPVELQVVETEIIYRVGIHNGLAIYVTHTLTGGHTKLESTPDMPGDVIYRTKKELLDSL